MGRSRPHELEPSTVALRTTAAATDGHRHVARFGPSGNGYTDEGPGGHVHRIHELDVLPANGHTHELTAVRVEVWTDEERHHRRGAA